MSKPCCSLVLLVDGAAGSAGAEDPGAGTGVLDAAMFEADLPRASAGSSVAASHDPGAVEAAEDPGWPTGSSRAHDCLGPSRSAPDPAPVSRGSARRL